MTSTHSPERALRAAVVGAGYWGPNLVRNFRAGEDWELAAVCDLDLERARRVVGVRRRRRRHRPARATCWPATTSTRWRSPPRPGPTRRSPMAALRAGKHVLVEKPLAARPDLGTGDGRPRRERGLVLMADHTYCYTPAVLQDPGAGGRRRARRDPLRRLGADQPRPGAARRRRLLGPGAARPVDPRLRPARRAPPDRGRGARRRPDRRGQGLRRLPDPAAARAAAIAHVHVNWLSPTKIRQMVIGGSRRTLVWDDLNPQQRLSVYDRGVDLTQQSVDAVDRATQPDLLPARRHWAPALPEREALGADGRRVRRSHPRRARARAPTARAGLRVLTVLEAAARSLATRAPSSPLDARVGGVVSMSTARRSPGPGHRRSRHDRLAPSSTSCSTPASPTSTCSTTSSAAAGQPERRPRLRARSPWSRATSATGTWSRDLTRGKDLVFHQAAIRITQCAEEPRLALEVLVDGTFNVVEAAVDAGVDKVVAASSASVYGMAEQFPTTERHHHHNNDTFYGAAKSFNEGMLRSFRAMYGPRLRAAALLQRLRPADGRPRPLHRGAGPLDGADRRRRCRR